MATVPSTRGTKHEPGLCVARRRPRPPGLLDALVQRLVNDTTDPVNHMTAEEHERKHHLARAADLLSRLRELENPRDQLEVLTMLIQGWIYAQDQQRAKKMRR